MCSIVPAAADFLHLSLQGHYGSCTITNMDRLIEADVVFLNFSGGAARITPPPGTLAQTSPRRSARGRRDDFLFLNLTLQSAANAPPGEIDHYARLAADVYYGTPGSVTSALREAAAVVNDQLMDAGDSGDSTQGSIMMAVLRGRDFYVAHCGRGHAVLIRPGQVTRYTSKEAEQRPLGTAYTPHLRYYHFLVNEADIIILTTASGDLWSESTLSGLSTLNPEQAVDRLVAASNQDLTGILARISPAGGTRTFPEAAAAISDPIDRVHASAQTSARYRPRGRSTEPSKLSLTTAGIIARATSFYHLGLRGLSEILNRVSPGVTDPLHPDALSRRMLIGIAVAVPMIIVALTAIVYSGKGKKEQFEEYYAEAAAMVATAQHKPLSEEARSDWEGAFELLERAGAYGTSPDYEFLRGQVEGSLDTLDLVVRLDFQPIVNGGFGTNADITALAASTIDVYVLDSNERVIHHAWGVPERGFEVDSTFKCLGGDQDFPEMGAPVDIVIQKEPGALGTEGVVAVDEDGTLLYCAPDLPPAIAQLTPPNIGWGRIQAIDVFGDSLYVLDPSTNSVWIYEATGGLFSGIPELYFVEDVQDLSSAIDLALAQDELVVLYADGRLDRCRRTREPDPGGGERIRVECDPDPHFQDERLDREQTPQIPGAVPIEMDYSAPPEPSLFFLDLLSNSVFHYSMRLVYQGQYLPLEMFDGEITAMTLGPPNDLYLAVGSQVLHAEPTR
jgi:hypothetical protein